MTIANDSISVATAVRMWREFAYKLQVTTPSGSSVSWAEYLKRYAQGRADERTIVGTRWSFQHLRNKFSGTKSAELSRLSARALKDGRISHPLMPSLIHSCSK